MMTLELRRYGFGDDSTLGKLFDITDGHRRFLCFTLEDERRHVKVYGETCIPTGTYPLALRREGDFHRRYSTRFQAIHKGMIWVRNVPDFEWILFHSGNTDEHTQGCVLVGTSAVVLPDGEFVLVESAKAYTQVYPIIAAGIEGGRVNLNVTEKQPE